MTRLVVLFHCDIVIVSVNVISVPVVLLMMIDHGMVEMTSRTISEAEIPLVFCRGKGGFRRRCC